MCCYLRVVVCWLSVCVSNGLLLVGSLPCVCWCVVFGVCVRCLLEVVCRCGVRCLMCVVCRVLAMCVLRVVCCLWDCLCVV